jgi:hypothetical protein
MGPILAREKVSHAFRDSLLKQNKIRGDGDETESDSSRCWMDAQDQIFGTLHLYSEPLRTDRGVEHHDRRTSTTITGASTGNRPGMETSTSTTITITSETMQQHHPVPEMYTNQHQRLQQQNQVLLKSRLPYRSDPSANPDGIMDSENTDNDQSNGNYDRIFPYSSSHG